jgi:hypothetical protein
LVFGVFLLWRDLSKNKSQAKPEDSQGFEIRIKPTVFMGDSAG